MTDLEMIDLGTKDETELILSAKKGDSRAFGQLMDDHMPQVYNLVRRYISDRMEIEDVVQEVFIRAYRSMKKFRGDSKFSTWIYRIAINHALKHSRRRRRFFFHESVEVIEQVPDRHQNPLDTVLEKDRTEMLNKMIQRLPEKQKAVLILRIEHDLQFHEIAAVMKRNIGTVKANYFHAIRKLQAALNREVEV